MNFLDIVNNELKVNNNIVLEEGLFNVSPAIAAFAFKDSFLNKAGSFSKKIKSPLENAVGKVAAGNEKIKADITGKSGSKDTDTVYKFTKEQLKVMAYLYKKYGPEMVNDIEKFRKDVMIPYQLVKRNVSKNRSLTNKEVYGMTKEDYYKYRESGRKKIEKKGTYFTDEKDLRNKNIMARDALAKANKVLNDFKSGKIVDLTATNIEKLLTDAGLGRKELNGWSDAELEKTANEISKREAMLKDASRVTPSGNIRVFGGANKRNAEEKSRDAIEYEIKKLSENGISDENGEHEDTGNHRGSFKDALSIYMLRREEMRKIRNNTSNAEYNKYYQKVLQDSIDAAKKIYDEKYENYMGLKGSIELNQFEKKIWGLKLTGVKYSGNINDWYLKIKPEAFFDTKYYKKSDKIVKAEKDIDASLKRFERDLKKRMSEDDVALCKKYRLFNNFLTVKELKDPSSMFKNTDDLDDLKSEPENNNEDEDIGSLIDSYSSKEYNSIRDLEDAQSKVKKACAGKTIDSDTKIKYNKFMKRVDPKNGSSTTKISRESINNIVDRINSNTYTGKTEASDDLKELNDAVDDFKEVNGEGELKQFEYDINKARAKISAFLQNKGEK